MLTDEQQGKFNYDILEGFLSDFEKHIRETDRGSSVRSYLGDVKRFIKWHGNKCNLSKVDSVSPIDIVEYRRHLQESGGRQKTGAAPTTINRALISIKIFFRWLKKKELITNNPAEGIKMVTIAATPISRWLNRQQQKAFIQAISESHNLRDEAIIGLMLHAGLRVSEVCSVKRKDVFIAASNGIISVTGKGNKYREVPLNSRIRDILNNWLEENKFSTLFPNRYGKSISTRGVFNLVTQYARRAQLERVTPHTLRHTFCKNAIDLGIPIDQVAAMAGHASLDITKRYTVPSRDDLQAAVERMALGIIQTFNFELAGPHN